MNENQVQRDSDRVESLGSVRFGIFVAVVFGGNAAGMAIFVGFLGLILAIPARSLVVPYLTLLYCGLVLSPLLYWARVAREQPRSCALRFATAMFCYLQVIMLALAVSAIRLHILSKAETVRYFGLLIVPLSAFMFVASYFVAWRTVKRRQAGLPLAGGPGF
jgi:hypothetical protein